MYSSRPFTSESFFKLRRHELQCARRKAYGADTSNRLDKKIKSIWGYSLPGLERRPAYKCCRVDISPCLTRRVLSIGLHHYNGVLETILSSVKDFADSLLRAEKLKQRQPILKVVILRTTTSSDINVLKRYMKILAGCEEITTTMPR